MVLIFDALIEYLPKEKIPRDPTEFQQQWDRHVSPIGPAVETGGGSEWLAAVFFASIET
jgi:hypothetical protein